MRIYGPPREHPPPQVHVIVGNEGEIVIRLGLGPGDSPKIWEAYNVSQRQVLRAYRIVQRQQEKLRGKWEEYHG